MDLWFGGSATTDLNARAWGDQISFFATVIVVGFEEVGEAFSRDLIGGLSWALGASITAGVLVAYHLTTMIGDQRARVLVPLPICIPSVGEPVEEVGPKAVPEFGPIEVDGAEAAILLLRGKHSADVARASQRCKSSYLMISASMCSPSQALLQPNWLHGSPSASPN